MTGRASTLALLALGTLLLAPPAGAVVLGSHVGANDPLSEGWTFSNNGEMLGTVGPVFGDGNSMLDAWSTNDDGSASNLSYGLDLPYLATATSWSYRVLLRVVDANDPVDFGVSAQVENGSQAYVMIFGTDAGGNVTVETRGTGAVTTSVVDGMADYHLFEFVEDDASDPEIEFWIDGSLIAPSYFGDVTNRTLAAFGDTSITPGSGGQGNYAEVTLEAVPEPAALPLLLTGAFALGLGRHARLRACCRSAQIPKASSSCSRTASSSLETARIPRNPPDASATPRA
jgi:hypothetical protein